MLTTWTDGRVALAGVIVCLASAFLVPQVPYLALFACALVLTEMSLRGRARQVAFLAGSSTAACGVLWGPGGAVIAAAGLIGLLVTIALIDRVDPWKALMVMAVGYSAAFFAADALAAWLVGESLIAGLRQGAQAAAGTAANVVQAMGGASAVADADAIASTLFAMWPASYMAHGLVTAMMVTAGVAYTARVHGARRVMPELAKIDLSPHILWLPIAGVSLLVAGELAGQGVGDLSIVGGNVLILAWPFFAWQGLAVVTGGLDRLAVPSGGRVLVYTSMFVMEALFLAGTLLGFVDIVANFRRLDRKDASKEDGAGNPAASS